MYSDWEPIQWDDTTDTDKEMLIPNSRITSEFLNGGGLVLMFMKAEGSAGVAIYPLPYLTSNGYYYFSFLAGDFPDAMDGEGFQGILFLLRSVDGMTAIPDYVWDGFEVRYVLIPGSVNLSEESEIDLRNYIFDSCYQSPF